MPALNSLELTGRAATHVREAPALGARLHPQAIDAGNALRAASAAAGIDLAIASSFRDFSRQAAIWNGKYRGERPLLDRAGRLLDTATLSEPERVRSILIWSALPGASRHHWGSDFDVYDRAAVPADYRPELTVAEFTGRGPFLRLNEWLGANLADYGFFRPYGTDRGGVHPEPWHLSYAPIAGPALQALTLEVLQDAVSNGDLAGREHVLAQLPAIYERYVVSVDTP